MKLGFSGTQKGMTEAQKLTFLKLIETLQPTHLLHGDCIGADDDAANLAREMSMRVIGYPPDLAHKRVFFKDDETKAPQPYLQRNHAIVDDCHVLVAAPRGYSEVTRSGTWATVRYARSIKRKYVIIFPNGTRAFSFGFPDIK